MWSILFQPETSREDELLLALWESATTGIVEEQDGFRAYFPDEIKPADILSSLSSFKGVGIRIESEIAVPFDRSNWDPILIGDRFYVAPPWLTAAPLPGRIKLEIDAATAFGTGRHETTQLCLNAIDRTLRPGFTIADIGCGSGILSLAAKLLGAGKVFSCDIQQDAVATAARHLSTPLFVGSADSLADNVADLVFANISAAVLDCLAFDLKRITQPDGLVIASGFIHEKTPRSFHPETTLEAGDWLCWICRRDDITPHSENYPGEGLSHKAEWWL